MRPKRAFGRWGVALACAACLILPHPAGALEGFAYTRIVDVPSAGRIRVPLDLAALRHMAPGGADLHVFAPDGTDLPLRQSVALPGSGRRAVQAGRAARASSEGAGWTQTLDTGTDPALHERLLLDLEQSAAPLPALSLEGSADGTLWQPLAAGVPVRLGGGEGLQRVALSYPSTADRYLRLRWPAEPPDIAAAEVETVAGPTLALSTRGAPCGRTASGLVCALDLPPEQVLRRLTVDLDATGAVGYRLYQPRESRWEPLAEGVWQTTGEGSRHVVSGRPEPIAGSPLRLELHGTAQTKDAPRLLGYGLDLAVLTVLFEASGPGRYILAYGGLRRMDERPGGSGGSAPGAATGALWIEPGPEQRETAARLPASPGAPLDRVRFASTWTVTAPEAEPGDLVRLELPAAVYGAARVDLGDLRVAAGATQLPFYRWSPPAPGLAGGESGLRPAGSDRPGESRVLISLPSQGLPLTQIHLTAPGAPLRRPVTVVYVDPDRRSPRSGRAAREPAARSTWECVLEPPLPCRARLALPSPAPRILTVRFRDGDNPRLPSVDVEVWRRRDVLLFVWPDLGETDEEAGVRLLAGARDLEAPRYDLAALGPALLGQPWEAAEIGGDGPPEVPWWSRWVMPIGVGAAAVWLLVLLRRILSEA